MGWRFLSSSTGQDFRLLENLSSNEGKVLAASYQTITLESDLVSIQNAVHFMDQFIGRLDRRTRLEFKAALALVEHSPLLFHGYFGRFTSLDNVRRKSCLEGWQNGASWRRPVFGALKDFCYLYYYTRTENWAKLGYAGPMVPVGAVNPSLESRYQGLGASS